jgi:hypothetical protein
MDASSTMIGASLMHRIAERRAECVRAVLDGKAADMSDYRGRIERIRAYEEMRGWITNFEEAPEVKIDAGNFPYRS